MKFALFYEIPVPRPWTPGKEHQAYKNTLEQAILGDKMGFHAFWTVEHHFLDEYSHCSNPEVLYGAVAARTENIRIGYGVRLLPKPYNHPIRTAESVAVLDLLSDGRVDFGTGRSSTRAELEGFGVDPDETREQWREALGHIVNAWTMDEYQADGKHWKMGAPRRIHPKPLQDPHPPIFGATSSPQGHEEIGRQGLGLCSFTVGLPPEALADNLALYRKGLARVRRSRPASSSTPPRPPSRWCTARPRTRRRPRSRRSRSSGTRDTAARSSRRSPSGRRSRAAPSSTRTSTHATPCSTSVRARWARSPSTTCGTRGPR